MSETREMLRAVFALDDEAKLEFAEWQRKQVVTRHSAPDTLIYKTYRPPSQQRQPQESAMDDTTAAKWNAWADDRILRQLQPAFDGAAVAAGEMHRMLEKQIVDLRVEVDALRTELNLAKAHNVARLREAG